MATNGWFLRDLSLALEAPGTKRRRDAHATFDSAVRAAYGMKEGEDILAFLFRLNLDCAALESKSEPVTLPGRAAFASAPSAPASGDCIQALILGYTQ